MSYIKQLKSRISNKTCLTNHTQSISHHITPLVINSIGADTQTDRQTHTHIATDAWTKKPGAPVLKMNSLYWSYLPKDAFLIHNFNVHYSSSLYGLSNRPTGFVCIIDKSTTVCFYWGFIPHSVWIVRVIGWYIHGPIWPGQADSWQGITKCLVGDWFSYILWYVELKIAWNDVIRSHNLLQSEPTATLGQFTTPNTQSLLECLWYILSIL